jgi:hypothetical protein
MIQSFQLKQKTVLMTVGNIILAGDTEKKDEITIQHAIEDLNGLKAFNKWYGVVYPQLFNKFHLSKYSPNFIEIAWSLRSCPLAFRISKNVKTIGSVNFNKSYTSLLAHYIKNVSVFDEWCSFQQYDNHDFEDGTLYVIKRKENVKYSSSKGDVLVLDKSHAQCIMAAF